MRTIIVCALGALALAACNKPAEQTPAAEDTATDASAMAPAGEGSSSTSGPSTAPSDKMSTEAAQAADDAAADTAAAAPADTGMPSGPSQATRDGAKEKAEATNLHP